ncbi:hypothetical protein HDU67_001282 [Dinochytrium kinnereticum]|nr:hypothetical protein HDU67_001282 [Dinochytrium kinnereticum]
MPMKKGRNSVDIGTSGRRNHVNAFVAASEAEKNKQTFYFDVDSDSGSIRERDIDDPYYGNGKRPTSFGEFSTNSDSSSEDTKFDVNDDIYDIVDAVVPRYDDPTTPALTFRVWVIGIFFSVILAFVNTLFTFRTNFFSLNPFIAVLVSYPLGSFMAWTLPVGIFTIPFTNVRFQLNPGPFSFKEHTLIYVFTVNAARPAYCLYNIVVQKYILGQPISIGWCLAFAVASQCFGYGLAGLTRKFLVRPASMLWPSNLGTIALLRSLHEKEGKDDEGEKKEKKGMSRTRFFWFCVLGMAIYQWFPSFIAPALGAISLLCHVAPNSQRLKMFGSAKQGLGMLSFTFDWSFITVYSPIVTPLWAFLNQFVGIWITMWIIIPFLWTSNGFRNDQQIGANPFDGANGTGQFPLGQALNSPTLFDKSGRTLSAIDILTITNHTVTLNEEAYQAVAPVLLTTYFAVQYASYFVMFSAVLCHVWLWYGKDLWYRFKTSMRDLDSDDIHAKMMDVYPEVSNLWYISILVITLGLAIAAGQWGGFDLPWWAVLLSLGLSGVCMIPIGTLEAISGQQIGLNVVSELVIGYILPGRMITVMSFKTLTYISTINGLFLVEDLKLGHYAKVPPRAMFTVQFFSTLMTTIINVLVAIGVYEVIGVDRMNNDPPLGWSPVGYQIFLSAGTIWGGIGPARFFGPDSPYQKCLYGFIIGFIAPLIFWVIHKIHPSGPWHLINVPLLAVFPMQAGTTRSDLITPLLVAILVNYVVRKYRSEWWQKYAYIMAAAFDTGAAISLTVILMLIGINPSYNIFMPFYYLNRADQESCAPEFYLECTEHMIWGSAFGRTYNVSEDSELCQTFGGDMMMTEL